MIVVYLSNASFVKCKQIRPKFLTKMRIKETYIATISVPTSSKFSKMFLFSTRQRMKAIEENHRHQKYTAAHPCSVFTKRYVNKIQPIYAHCTFSRQYLYACLISKLYFIKQGSGKSLLIKAKYRQLTRW